MYYLISRNEDGDIYIEEYSCEKLEAELNEDDDAAGYKFIGSIPSMNPQDWAGNNVRLLIKGEIIVPRAVQKVTKFVLD